MTFFDAVLSPAGSYMMYQVMSTELVLMACPNYKYLVLQNASKNYNELTPVPCYVAISSTRIAWRRQSWLRRKGHPAEMLSAAR